MSSFLGSFSVIKFSFYYAQSIIVTISIFAVRYLVLTILNGRNESNLPLLAMVPKGLAAAVLISLYVSKNNIENYDNIYFLTYGVILNSIIITSSIVYYTEKKRLKSDIDEAQNNSKNIIKANKSSEPIKWK